MSQPPDPFAAFSGMAGQAVRSWEEAMESWWTQAMASPAFRTAMSEHMVSGGQARGAYEEQVDRTLRQLHLPTREDIARMLRVASLLEDRLLAMEDRLLAMEDRLDGLERDVLKARLDAAEALLSTTERLEAMERRLAKVEGG